MGPGPALVGRPVETATLDALLTSVSRGRGTALAVVGEAGIGKSRLLAELGDRADALGMLVLSGAASEFEQDLPFWPFVDALDDFVRGLPPERLAGLDDGTRSELAHVLPSWPAALPATSGRPDTDRRYRTHRSVCRLLEVLAARPPLVLLLDDLHWADSGSVELLCALLRRPPAGPVLLATALRPRQVAARLAGALHRAADAGLVTRIEPAALTLADTRRLLGPDIDESLIRRLHAESGGNPFYLRQLAQVRQARAATDTPLDIDVPSAVAAALGDELANLDEVTRRALEAAAVAGDPFLLEIAAAAAALPEAAMADALDDLQHRDLVRPTETP